MKQYYQFDETTRKNTIHKFQINMIVWFSIIAMLFVVFIFVLPIEDIFVLTIYPVLLLGVFIYGNYTNNIVYGNVILLQSDCIEVYNYRNKLFRTIRFSEVGIAKKKVVFMGSNIYNHKIEEGLILYNNIKLKEIMDYRKYQNNKEIFFIQNPELIQAIESIINK